MTVGTVFEGSKVSISKWLLALHLMASSKKGMSALQLQRMLGITYRAAWFVMHRLRHAMTTNANLFNRLQGDIEVDETFVGGRRKHGYIGGRKPSGGKVPVVALVQRGGQVRASTVQHANTKDVWAVVRKHMDVSANLITDESPLYLAIGTEFPSHTTVNHSRGEYVRGNTHTNTVEGFFSLLKRGITGSFHHVSKGHLHRYVDEFTFRYNTRVKLGFNDGDRAALIVKGADGKRLTYKKREVAGAA